MPCWRTGPSGSLYPAGKPAVISSGQLHPSRAIQAEQGSLQLEGLPRPRGRWDRLVDAPSRSTRPGPCRPSSRNCVAIKRRRGRLEWSNPSVLLLQHADLTQEETDDVLQAFASRLQSADEMSSGQTETTDRNGRASAEADSSDVQSGTNSTAHTQQASDNSRGILPQRVSACVYHSMWTAMLSFI